MGSKPTRQRARRGSAWFWKQTNCWYYTPEGGKRRVPLFDQAGKRIRGAENKQAAELALARVRLATDGRSASAAAPASPSEAWCVAKVCSEYLQACQQRKTAGTMSAAHCTNVVRYLNEFCKYAGALPVEELKRGDVQYWLESHPTWGAVTRRNILTMLQAAFNHAGHEHGLRNPIKGLKKPPPQPRLASFSPEEEQTLYAATDRCFADFLFAAIHTGLRPFCELARLTADEVDDMPRGMLWRVRSPKTKRTRKIPIRPEVAKLARSLMRTAPQGSGKPLFRNPQGNRWKKVTGVSRFTESKPSWAGTGGKPEPLFLLYLPAHVRPSDAFGILERRRRLFDRDAGRTDGQYAQGGLRSLRQGMGTTLSRAAVGCDGAGRRRAAPSRRPR